MKYVPLVFVIIITVTNTGCKTLLPSGTEGTSSQWKTYQDAENAFNYIVPNVTTVNDLRQLGIDFKTTPNVKLLTYLDLMERFKLDSALFFNNLKPPPGIEEALSKHEHCIAYEIDIVSIRNDRVGGFWKDTLGFRQVTRTTGWKFNGLIVIVDNVVVYVLHSGEPMLDSTKIKKQPLGPLQKIDGSMLIDAVDGL